MAQGINLLPELTEQEVKKEFYRRKISVVSIAALLSVAIVLLGIFAYQLFLQTSRSRVEREAKSIEKQILEQQDKEILQRTLVDKLNQIRVILSEAVPISSAVANISNLARESGGISIKSVDLKSDGDVSLAGAASNSRALGRFFNAVISSETQKIFDQIVLNHLSRDKGSPFNFSINMDFKPRGLIEK